MPRTHHPRRLAATLLAGAVLLGLTACNRAAYPHSVFSTFTEFNTDITNLHKKLFFFGTIVFVIVEALLLYTIFRFRRKPGQAEPKHVHGNTTLEVLWTAIPAVILLFIAVPTVRTIFRTQAKAKPGALQVEVIGHQWWWEFRYPEYNITTANELYIPTGRTVNFALKTADVLHAFWIPALGGKRDLIANHTNYLWFTPDSALGTQAFYGHCTEYCGASHANMRIRTFTVTPAEFERWVKLQQSVAAFGATPAASAAAGQSSGPQTVGAPAAAAATQLQAGARSAGPNAGEPAQGSDAAVRSQSAPTQPGFAPPVGNQTGAPAGQAAAAQTAATTTPTDGFVFPAERMPKYLVPSTPIPKDIKFDESLLAKGDPARGQQAFISCIGCHYVNGNPLAQGKIGPNLTHFGSRHTIGSGLYPNDAKHLAYWLKNTRKMKPGVIMPTLGKGEIDPVTKKPVTAGGLTDQQIADLVAYLQALK